MDLEIRTLEMTIENAIKQSPLPPEIKRLVLSEQESKIAAEAQEAIIKQSREVKEKDAESVSEN